MAKGRSHLNRRDEGFRPIGNEDLARASRERGRSSAASPHVSKPRKGTRSAKRMMAIRDGF